MALRAQNDGGYSFALPAAYSDTQDLSFWLWLRRGATADQNDRIFLAVNSARTRGFILTTGGGSTGVGGTATEAVLSVGSGSTAGWGTSTNHNGRGRVVLGGISNTTFTSFAASLRGPSSPDFTGTNGANQIHQSWCDGIEIIPAAVGSAAAGTPTTGGVSRLFFRDSTTPNYFDGWIGEVAIWQGYRLTSTDIAALHAGALPNSIQPGALLLYRSLRTSVTAEVGDTSPTSQGIAPVIDTNVHPAFPVALTSSRAVHGHTAKNLTLLSSAALSVGRTAHGHTADVAVLSAMSSLAVQKAVHTHRSASANLSAATLLAAQRARHLLRSREPGLVASSAILCRPDDAQHALNFREIILRLPPGFLRSWRLEAESSSATPGRDPQLTPEPEDRGVVLQRS